MTNCMKNGCNTDLDGPGVIKVKFPVFFKGQFLDYLLCRTCFLKADSLNGKEFTKWVHKEAKS